MHEHHHEPHPCPRTGKCCGRCKLAIPGDAAVTVGLRATEHSVILSEVEGSVQPVALALGK